MEILDFMIGTPQIILNYAFLLGENKMLSICIKDVSRYSSILMLKTYGNLSYKVCQEIWEDKAGAGERVV